jgi:hypothetical protein
MAKTREAKIETYLVAGVQARGGWCAKVIDKGRRGCPDRECRFPEALLIYIETKCTDGVVKPWQKTYHADLHALGFTVLVLWTIGQVEKFLGDYDRGVYG